MTGAALDVGLALLMAAVGVLVGAGVGGILGAVVGAAVAVPAAALYARATMANGAYDRSSLKGWGVFALDCTWSLPNTMAGALFLTLNLALGNTVDRARGRRSGCVHLVRGIIPGFATTIGPVIAGAGRHIERHERLHVTQARLFGPLYLPLVAANYVVATVLPYWLLYHDRRNRPIRSLRDYFMRGVYPHTWHEQWAYSVEGTPP